MCNVVDVYCLDDGKRHASFIRSVKVCCRFIERDIQCTMLIKGLAQLLTVFVRVFYNWRNSRILLLPLLLQWARFAAGVSCFLSVHSLEGRSADCHQTLSCTCLEVSIVWEIGSEILGPFLKISRLIRENLANFATWRQITSDSTKILSVGKVCWNHIYFATIILIILVHWHHWKLLSVHFFSTVLYYFHVYCC